MEPKKKSNADAYIALLFLVLIMYCALQAAVCWNEAKSMEVTGLKGAEMYLAFFDLFSTRLASNTFSFAWCKYSSSFLSYGFFAWFIGSAYYFTTRRNYISGKEYGTSRWGTRNDIQDLFAENIERKEIKDAKKVGNPFLRYFVKKSRLKAIKEDGRTLLKQKLDSLSSSEFAQKSFGTYDSEAHKQAVLGIKTEVAEFERRARLEAWPPYKYMDEYKARVSELDNGLYTPEERNREILKAKSVFDNKTHKFYYGKEKVVQIHEKYKDANMILTASERMSINKFKLNNNTLVIGGAGSGKTRGLVLPNMLQAHSSYVVTDSKGEILEKCGYFLSKVKGYKIRVLNLQDKIKSDGYNPFVYIHPEREGYEERVLSLIEAIIINTDGGEKRNSSDPFWEKAERLFLQAIFYFTVDGFFLSERNMNTVLALIGMLKIEEEQDNYDSDLDYFARLFEREHGSDHIGVQQYKEFREKASGKTAKSVVISAVARLAPFRTSSIRKMFEHDSMHLDRVGEEKMAIFVVVPPTDSTFNFIAGMMYTQLFQELEYCATQVHKHDGQRLPVPCRFVLDEFANTCTIPNFIKILSYSRSFGIGIMPIIQSLDQIKKMYKDEWGVIIDNCSSLLYLGSISHMDTLKYMSELIGKGTFDKRTTGRNRGRQGSSSQNFDKIGRELMDAAEIGKLDESKCILHINGRNPFYSDKYNYISHPNYRYTSDGDHSFSYEHTPKPKEPEEFAHSEQILNVQTPSENAKVTVDKITVDDSLLNMVNRLGHTFTNLIPALDDELIVDDGEADELTPEQEKELFSALMAEDEANKILVSKIMSDSTASYLANLKQQIITIEPPDSHIISLVKSLPQQIPAPNDVLDIDDGEQNEAETKEFEEYIFEDSSNDVSALADNILDNVSALVKELDNVLLSSGELSAAG